jgi:hypothetical protein
MIQNSKLMLTFAWNLHGFEIVDVLSKGEMFTTSIISEIFWPRSLLDMEREVKGGCLYTRTMQGHNQQKWHEHLRWQFHENGTTSIVLTGPSSLWLFDFSCLCISKITSKDGNLGLQMNFFGSWISLRSFWWCGNQPFISSQNWRRICEGLKTFWYFWKPYGPDRAWSADYHSQRDSEPIPPASFIGLLKSLWTWWT